jgi:hypothetical protein
MWCFLFQLQIRFMFVDFRLLSCNVMRTSTQRYNTEDKHQHIHRRENLSSHTYLYLVTTKYPNSESL